MSTLARFRSLAAALALLLFLSANATAFVEKPIDTPEGPIVPHPAEVGEPDTGQGLPATWREYVIAASLSHPILRRLVISLVRPYWATSRTHAAGRGWR